MFLINTTYKWLLTERFIYSFLACLWMVDPNSHKTMENFAQGIIDVNSKIHELNPDVLLYPIRGAIPIVDLLRIVDPSISGMNHEYVPASSTIENVDGILHDWFLNYLREQHVLGEKQSFLGIDEVVSGQSVFRVARQLRRAIGDYANEKNVLFQDILEEISYHSVGIQDMRHVRVGKPMDKNYSALVERGTLFPVEVMTNLVMDKPLLCPLKLARIPGHRYAKCYPVMTDYNVSREYIDFLTKFAHEIGQDISSVSLQSPARIRNSERFLPEKYHEIGREILV